jgi:hypothetical protein
VMSQTISPFRRGTDSLKRHVKTRARALIYNYLIVAYNPLKTEASFSCERFAKIHLRGLEGLARAYVITWCAVVRGKNPALGNAFTFFLFADVYGNLHTILESNS